MFEFSLAKSTDLPRIIEIINQAKQQMYREGKQQWNENYPAAEDIANDIKKNYGYVLTFEKKIIAYAAVVFDGEPAYESINGKWLSESPYVVVHRLAVADEMKQKGMAIKVMQEIEKLCAEKDIFSFKVDTNFDNFYMQKVLNKCGFSYCGEIYYLHGTRRAYEKLLNQEQS